MAEFIFSQPYVPPSAGAVNIATSQSTSSATYTTLATPDQVTGIVLPTNGLIAVWYQATWQESVVGGAQAAIFLGANQAKRAVAGTAAPAAQACFSGQSTTANLALPLVSYGGGLVSTNSDTTTAYTGDVTTGQMQGITNPNATYSGPAQIFATAGTYTVSVQFRASSGTVTASNRKLWVETRLFG